MRAVLRHSHFGTTGWSPSPRTRLRTCYVAEATAFSTTSPERVTYITAEPACLHFNRATADLGMPGRMPLILAPRIRREGLRAASKLAVFIHRCGDHRDEDATLQRRVAGRGILEAPGSLPNCLPGAHRRRQIRSTHC